MVLLKVGCLQPDVPLLGKNSEGMGVDGPGTLIGLMSSTLREAGRGGMSKREGTRGREGERKKKKEEEVM